MNAEVTQRLSTFISRHLPLIQNMGLSISSYDGETLILEAPLSVNHNDKGSAFGGSLYNLCIVNAIGLAFLKCFEKGINPDLIVSEASIKYLSPVTDPVIQSVCISPDKKQWDSFFEHYRNKGKAKMPLEAKVFCNGSESVSFSGMFVLIGESDTTIC